MSSVFDYDVNERELHSLLINGDKEVYLKTTSKFKRYSDMYHLFVLRGNRHKAEEISNKLSNE